MDFSAWTLQSPELHVRQNVAELNPAPSPSGHPLLSGPPNFGDIPQIFTTCFPKLRSALLARKMVWAWLAPPRLARLVRGLGGAHQSGILYGGAAAACAVAAGSLYYSDHLERSKNNNLPKSSTPARRGCVPSCTQCARGLPEQAKPTLPGAGMAHTRAEPARAPGGRCRTRWYRTLRAAWPVPRCVDCVHRPDPSLDPGFNPYPNPNPNPNLQAVPDAEGAGGGERRTRRRAHLERY